MFPENIIVVDIEATGFSFSKDMIVEIGVVRIDKNYEIHEELHTVCKEQKPLNVSAWIFKNSNLTVNEVKKAVDFKTLKPRLQSLFDLYPTTSFNMKFDIDFLENRGVRIRNPWYDIMYLAKRVCKIPSNGTGYYGKYKTPSMQEAYEYILNKPLKHNHRALFDARDEAEILIEIMKNHQYAFNEYYNDFT